MDDVVCPAEDVVVFEDDDGIENDESASAVVVR